MPFQHMRRSLFAAGTALLLGTADNDPPRFADLGACPTLGGDVILQCRVAYRTFGRLNDARDNAILVPSWYGGTSVSLMRLLGTFVDTTRFHVILTDALGNGVSTAPSNSQLQPGVTFPRLTLADMVIAQRRLLREHLGISRLHAVVGFSMGGEQALEWAVRFPDDVAAVVSLHGSPRAGAYDTFVYRSLRWMVRLARSGALPADSVNVPIVDLWNVIRATPARVDELPLRDLDETVLRTATGRAAFDPRDDMLQLEALLAHDVSADFGGDLARAAAAVRARMLVIVSPDDRIVSSEATVEFARAAGAELLEVPSRCGHFALYCEPLIAERVRGFLSTRTDGSVSVNGSG